MSSCKAGAPALLAVGLAVTSCASSSEPAGIETLDVDAPMPDVAFHHLCYGSLTQTLFFGTDDDLRSRMTDAFVARRAPQALLAEFEGRIGRDRVEVGKTQNIDGFVSQKAFGRVQRVLFIPDDPDKRAYVLFIKNTPGGCKLDDVQFK